MTQLKIVPYKRFSDSATRLRDALRAEGVACKIVQRNSPTYRSKSDHILLNWGCTDRPIWPRYTGRIDIWINYASSVEIAANKLLAFQKLKEAEVSTPDWTVNKDEAIQWVTNGEVVVCRTILNGSGGAGIILAATSEELAEVNAPLYVKYKKKRHEYRIHVFNGKVIDVQQKRKRKDVEVNSKIRNLANGWVFCRENIMLPEGAKDLAIRAVSSLGLTFGAVDIIENEKEKSCSVLEVNTAPGLEGSTVQSYALAIKEWLDEGNK